MGGGVDSDQDSDGVATPVDRHLGSGLPRLVKADDRCDVRKLGGGAELLEIAQRVVYLDAELVGESVEVRCWKWTDGAESVSANSATHADFWLALSRMAPSC